MSRNVKISAWLGTLFIVIATVIGLASGGREDPAPQAAATPMPATADAPAEQPTSDVPVVRTSDARQLGPKGSSGVTFTEFLDFECESCRAAFPLVEALRAKYEGKVTFVLRYFPIESHANAMNAATAVEAAFQQGKLEPMYKQMYATQESWGEQQTSQASLFRGFARELGLDMGQFDADVKNPKTRERVREDVEAGRAVGVQGTPSFFINEERIIPKSAEEIQQALDAAIAAS